MSKNYLVEHGRALDDGFRTSLHREGDLSGRCLTSGFRRVHPDRQLPNFPWQDGHPVDIQRQVRA